MNKPKIVFLSAKSGGGHDGASRATQTIIEQQHPDVFDFEIIDIYTGGPEKLLPLLAKIRNYSNLIWFGFLLLTNNRYSVALTRLLMRHRMKKKILKLITEQERVTHLIAAHFNPAQILDDIAAALPNPVSTTILATDYDPHWAWIGHANRLIVCSDKGYQKAQNKGYAEANLLKLSVLPSLYSATTTAKTETNSLALSKKTPFKILMIAGKEGTHKRKIIKLLSGLDKLGGRQTIEVDVFCGINENLKASLTKYQASLPNIKLQALGFVNDFHQRLAQYDLAILRASPQTLSEIIYAEIPVLAFDWSVHERYQADFIQQHGIGHASKNTDYLLKKLEALLHNESESHYQNNISHLRGKIDHHQLVDFILSLPESLSMPGSLELNSQ